MSGVGASTTFRATATAGPAARVTLSADTVRVDHHGGSARLSATVVDAHGNGVAAEPLTWTSSDTLVVRVGADGSVVGRRPGAASVRAHAAGVAGAAVVVVPLQSNARCVVPQGVPSRGAVRGLPSFVHVQQFTELPPPAFDMKENAVADFDRDGDEDIIIFTSNFPPNPDRGEVLFWRNVGGRFVDATREVLGPTPIRAAHTRQLEIRDLNGDGFPDVFAVQHGYDSSPDGAPSLLLLSRGDGTMRDMAPTHLVPYRTDNWSHASAAGDIDCDGDVDVLSGSGGGAHGRQHNDLYVNDGAGRFTSEKARLPANAADPVQLQVTSALLCDFDQDGDQDLFMGASHKAVSAFFLNDGFGRFRPAAEPRLPVPRYGLPGNVVDARCADVNLDGLPDLLLSTAWDVPYSPSVVELWLNEGHLVFRDATEEWVGPEKTDGSWVWRITVRDFNADGWPDLHLRTVGAADAIHVNRGGRGFTHMTPTAINGSEPIDADRDGRPDLLWPGGVGRNGETHGAILFRNR